MEIPWCEGAMEQDTRSKLSLHPGSVAILFECLKLLRGSFGVILLTPDMARNEWDLHGDWKRFTTSRPSKPLPSHPLICVPPKTS